MLNSHSLLHSIVSSKLRFQTLTNHVCCTTVISEVHIVGLLTESCVCAMDTGFLFYSGNIKGH